MKMTCEKCGIEYEGHHRSKRCDACKGTAESLGSDVVVEGVADEFFVGTTIDRIIPNWRDYGMCDGGYEVWPGWVWSQKKLVCANGDAPKEVLEWLQDAIQRPVVNRRPILGDDDYPGGK